MLLYHIETHHPGLTTWARALLKSDTVRNVFLYGVQLLALQLDAYDSQGDQFPSNRSLLFDNTDPTVGSNPIFCSDRTALINFALQSCI